MQKLEQTSTHHSALIIFDTDDFVTSTLPFRIFFCWNILKQIPYILFLL